MNSNEPSDLPAHTGSTVDALAAAGASADAGARHACAVADQLLGLSAVSLRQQGYTDPFIAHRLKVDPARLAAAARSVGVLIAPGDEHLRIDVEQRWDHARRGLVWYQDDRVAYSRDVVRLYDIDATASQPLSVDALDLPAAEFVNNDTGERLIAYSLQRWKGLPAPRSQPGAPVWSHHGHFTLECVTPAGERMVVSVEDWLDLPAGSAVFSAHGEQRNTLGSDGVFDRIVVAFRRKYGALPPYLEAATLGLTFREPR